MKPSTVLKKARKLIERGWCRGDYAKTKEGRPIPVMHEAAYRFCSLGAIQRVAGATYCNDTDAAVEYLRRSCDEAWVHKFNDAQNSKRPVLALYGRAIKLAEKENR